MTPLTAQTSARGVPPSGQSLEHLVEGFPGNPMRAREEIERLGDRDQDAFLDDAIPLVLAAKTGQGYRFLLARLLTKGLLVEILSNPARMSHAQGVEFLRAAAKMDPHFDVKLTRWLLDGDNREWVASLGARSEALLGVLAEASPGNRLLPLLVQFLRSKGERVSSKAAMLVAQRSQRVELALADEDARVRANAIEALWGMDTLKARRTLHGALDDPNNRVVGNALLGLLRLGDRTVIPNLMDMAKRDDPAFRASAAWVMGQVGDPRFRPVLVELCAGGPDIVTAAAKEALARLPSPSSHHGAPRTDAHMRALRLCRTEQGKNRLSLHLRLPESAANIPLEFEVRVDGEQVSGVQFRRFNQPSLALGVLLPAVWPDEAHAATRTVMGLRRPADRIALCRYSQVRTADGGAPAGAYQPIRGLSLGPGTAPPLPKINYSLEPQLPPRITQEPAATPSLFDALGALLNAPAGLSAQAGVLLVATPGVPFEHEPPKEALDSILRVADAQGGTIHALAGSGLSETGLTLLRFLCRETGGYLLCSTVDAGLPALAEMLYRELTEGFEVTFPSKTDAKSVSLECNGAGVRGQGSIALEEPPPLTRHGESVWFL